MLKSWLYLSVFFNKLLPNHSLERTGDAARFGK